MTAQRLALAADHGGLQLKTELASWLQPRESERAFVTTSTRLTGE